MSQDTITQIAIVVFVLSITVGVYPVLLFAQRGKISGLVSYGVWAIILCWSCGNMPLGG